MDVIVWKILPRLLGLTLKKTDDGAYFSWVNGKPGYVWHEDCWPPSVGAIGRLVRWRFIRWRDEMRHRRMGTPNA